jgi:quercetin dioxygenase-like cupin family protein
VTVAAFVVGVMVGVAVVAPAAPRVVSKNVLNLVTDELHWARTNVRVNLNIYEPGVETGRHRHPGPTILHVLEGQLEEEQAGQTRVLKAGDTVWSTGRAPHNLRNRTTDPTRVLAVHLDPGR